MKAGKPILAPQKNLKQTFQLGNCWDWNVQCSVDCLICHATSAGRKAGRLSTNTAQSVERLSMNKAYHDVKTLLNIIQLPK